MPAITATAETVNKLNENYRNRGLKNGTRICCRTGEKMAAHPL
jgi:hypothetical protein